MKFKTHESTLIYGSLGAFLALLPGSYLFGFENAGLSTILIVFFLAINYIIFENIYATRRCESKGESE